MSDALWGKIWLTSVICLYLYTFDFCFQLFYFSSIQVVGVKNEWKLVLGISSEPLRESFEEFESAFTFLLYIFIFVCNNWFFDNFG